MNIYQILTTQPRPKDITTAKILLFKYVCVYLEAPDDENKVRAIKQIGQLMKYYHTSPDRESCNPLKQQKTAKDVLFALSQIGINEHGHYMNLNAFLKTFLSYE